MKAKTNRDFVLEVIKRMPANASFQTILRELDEILLAESIKRSLKQNKEGKGIPAKEVSILFQQWMREARQKKRACK